MSTPASPAPTPGPVPGPIPVVAAVVVRDGRYLVGRRPDHKRHGGLWEFPGGKLDPGESWADGAARELAEELAVTLDRLGDVLFEARDPRSPFLIRFFEAEVSGTIEAREHSAVDWFTPAELAGMPLAPTDAAFVREVLGQ